MQAPNASTWNEQDVREIIIRPLLDKLGYAKDTENDILTGYCLKHPYAKYGRKEIPVKAFSDYILDVGGMKWVLEAKPPVPLSDDDVDQSYSYAAHYEVHGLYFAISNGLELRVYITQNYRRGITPDRIFSFDELRQEVEGTSNRIALILAPDSIRREYPRPPMIEKALPLAPTLRSSARIRTGQIVFTRTHPLLHEIEGVISTILSGVVTRNDKGIIVADIETCVPNAKLQELNRQFALDKMTLIANKDQLSVDEQFPTALTSEREIFFPVGTTLASFSMAQFRLPFDMNVKASTRASGVLAGRKFSGTFDAFYIVRGGAMIQAVTGGQPFDASGTFTVELE
jgi:hypothetical protein